MTAVTACESVDQQRVPDLAVNLNLTPLPVWQNYGPTQNPGDARRFILAEREPSGFPWMAQTRTGYGGLLIVWGFDPFTSDPTALAYDLSCPVECKPDVRVAMVEGDDFPVAQCPLCKSRYDVVQRGGAPISGKALQQNWGLRSYLCVPPANADLGGFLITNKY